MIKELFKNVNDWLLSRKDPRILFLFRILYGLSMIYTIINYFRIELIKNMFVLPGTNFSYDFLSWLVPLPEAWMNVMLLVLLICAVGITTGIFFKWCCRIFALGYAYIFLIDKSIYNNHIYLFILLAILLSFTDADKGLSVSGMRGHKVKTVPRWQILSIQAQIVIVYFYGGIAKLTYDWIVRCQPVRFLLDNLSPDHFLATFLKNEGAVYTLTYGGLLIDILAPFLLWVKPLRRWAIYPFVLFHLVNSRIFTDIGIFPYLMLMALFLFYEWSELPLLRRIPFQLTSNAVSSEKTEAAIKVEKGNIPYPYFLIAYFTFQVLFPFRGLFLPNDLDWTTIGNRFSWRMKVDTRELVEMKFTLIDAVKNEAYPVDYKTMVNDMQVLNLSKDPRSVADLAKYIKSEALKYGVVDPRVNATIITRYNGRTEQFFVDPKVDLTKVTYNPFTKLSWVVPLNREDE